MSVFKSLGTSQIWLLFTWWTHNGMFLFCCLHVPQYLMCNSLLKVSVPLTGCCTWSEETTGPVTSPLWSFTTRPQTSGASFPQTWAMGAVMLEWQWLTSRYDLHTASALRRQLVSQRLTPIYEVQQANREVTPEINTVQMDGTSSVLSWHNT